MSLLGYRRHDETTIIMEIIIIRQIGGNSGNLFSIGADMEEVLFLLTDGISVGER